ncbi:TauD/TfdA dioxygenase family protein [Chitinasiproducens palmae]|uniref:Alpha-ketoglutarate-dependent 2,4-dichlorophenoxyacetate dioxygenase n=1 Tax=Chitinasiproducens palmae TaxID=1770053 RepID=A0A1H2PUC8_9BURK|nr:TauD/TfdA family dioxygenase [Chitinasiproducens palmae]SDV50768.1 alpha-ketoglutarate-dependent 2,4-dichlorophenoxyacetate dioxygenase [Chitinasiproducens palmae]
MLIEAIGGPARRFGAVVTGLDPASLLSDETSDLLAQTLADYAVVAIRDQALSDDQQLVLAHRFGPIHESILDASRRRLADRRFNDVGNVDVSGGLKRASDPGYGDANLLWHADLSFLARPARVTLLSARALPPEPPPTEYADMRAAWDALPPGRQAALEGLEVEHSVFVQRAKCGFADFTEAERSKAPPVRHPLVRRHPASGRRALYLSSSASHVVGWPEDEGRALLEELVAHATQPAFVLSYAWRPRDLLIWDNSVTMHRATPFESATHRRELRWTAVVEAA